GGDKAAEGSQEEQKYLKDLNHWLPITSSRSANWSSSAYHNVTAMVGAGVLGLPYAMSELGWGPGVTIMVLSWVITLYTLWQLVEMHEVVPGKRFDRYHELGQHAFGEKLGLWVVVPQQLMVEVGVNIVYMVTGGKSLQKAVYTFSPGAPQIRTTYFIMFFGVIHFFLSHLPSFNSLTMVSAGAALMSLSYSTIAWAACLHKGVQPDVKYTPRASTSAGRVFQFFAALGDISFAFAGHNVVLEIQAGLPSSPEKPSKKPMWKGVVVAYLVVALCYFPVSMLGYWVYGNKVEDNVLMSLEKPAWLVAIANLCVVVHVMGSYQVFAVPVFDMVETFLVKNMNFKPTKFLRIVTRSSYVALTMFLAITFPFFGGLLSFFGGFAFAPTSYYVLCNFGIKRQKMHSLPFPTPHLFTFPSPRILKPCNPLNPNKHSHVPFPEKPIKLSANAFTSDEFPVDETFLEAFGPKEKESEDEARRHNWIDRGWAPWEEILTPEADFARKSLNEGEEVPLQNPDSIEAFNMLTPKYRKQKMEEMGLTEDEYYAKQFEIKGEIPEKLETMWAGPVVLRHVPPRDWPPRGWGVDKGELEFIREAHKLQAVRIDYEGLEKEARTDTEGLCLDRYRVFLKQYNEWVAANKDRLEEEAYKYELPFYYPGQICAGKVTTLHLYQGAFVDIGGVHDGWVPIKRNDWYWIRHHIKVGMHVIVEILAKRDPYRFRFPIEMRFVDPNIDHLIFNRFDFPPIFHRDEDTNPDELRDAVPEVCLDEPATLHRDCGRPPIPRKDPGDKVEEEPLLSNHPYVDKLWQLHNAEQLILDDMEANPDKYKNKKLTDLTDDEDFDEENNVEYTKAYYKKTLLPKTILKTSVKELDLEAALAERQHHNELRREARERGEKYKVTQMRRTMEMDEYDLIHWRRSYEEREALIRDISCRQALGLPLEEPGRYVDANYGKDEYNPANPLYRYDYWGEPKNSEKSKQERLTDAHNKSIVGKGTVWYELSYEDAIKQQMQREALGITQRDYNEEDAEKDMDGEDDDDEDDFDYSILGDPSEDSNNKPLVNGTESFRMSDEGMFEN
ncbi:hypothetical protein RJ639_026927, partial [Escallonia herrerae]